MYADMLDDEPDENRLIPFVGIRFMMGVTSDGYRSFEHKVDGDWQHHLLELVGALDYIKAGLLATIQQGGSEVIKPVAVPDE